MAAKVIKAFRHANTGIVYSAGDEFAGTDEQALELQDLGFVEVAAAPEGADGGDPEDPDRETDERPLGELTADELRALCAEYGIEVPSKAKKENLVAAVELYCNEAGAEDGEDGADAPEGE